MIPNLSILELGSITSDLQATQTLGQKQYHPNRSRTTKRNRLTGQDIVSVLCLNSSGTTLVAGDVVKGAVGAKYTITSKVLVTAELVWGVVDPWLPSTGVPNGKYFNLIIGGRCYVNKAVAGTGSNVAAGAYMTSLTAATSQAATAGKAYAVDWTGATAVLANQIQNACFQVVTAATTAETEVYAELLTYRLAAA